jgi:hypothetical protein
MQTQYHQDQKVSKTPISTNKVDLVVHTSDRSYTGGHTQKDHGPRLALGKK